MSPGLRKPETGAAPESSAGFSDGSSPMSVTSQMNFCLEKENSSSVKLQSEGLEPMGGVALGGLWRDEPKNPREGFRVWRAAKALIT